MKKKKEYRIPALAIRMQRIISGGEPHERFAGVNFGKNLISATNRHMIVCRLIEDYEKPDLPAGTWKFEDSKEYTTDSPSLDDDVLFELTGDTLRSKDAGTAAKCADQNFPAVPPLIKDHAGMIEVNVNVNYLKQVASVLSRNGHIKLLINPKDSKAGMYVLGNEEPNAFGIVMPISGEKFYGKLAIDRVRPRPEDTVKKETDTKLEE